MAKKKKEEPLDFENMTPEELLKYEIADEIGLGDKILKGGWKSLTSKESGHRRRYNDKTIATLLKNEYNDYSYKTVLIAGVPCVELTAL